MKTLKNKKVLIFLVVIILLVSIVGISYSQLLYNNEEIIPSSDLIYYLDIYYDGVDKDGVKSNDTTLSNVNSEFMIVEDKIPNGLTFNGFVTTSDGTIGATKRDNNSSCIGSVYDDTKEEKVNDGTWNNDNTEYYYHGLHYNANTKMVTFKVKDLQAGCKITVGIKTLTPNDTDDSDTDVRERRRDFFNFALIRENEVTSISNIVHAYMGETAVKFYNINYSYTGNVPANAPSLPTGMQYALNDIVGIMMPIEIEGYTFSGWTTNDVTVTDGVFVVPNHDVNFTGSYTQDEKHKVKYVIDGIVPNNYSIPSEKEYYTNHNVDIDKVELNDYSFSGWTTNDIIITENETSFMMPNHDVTFTGSFTEKKYTITYEFYNTVLPDNINELLPTSQTVFAGEVISLPDVNDVSGYKFVGWNKENSFVMPNRNITIYGEWQYDNGIFEPSISIEIEDPKEIYRFGDTIKYKITVKNNDEFAINDIVIKENTDNAQFISGNGYSIQSNHYATIRTLAGNEEKNLYVEYIIQKDDLNQIVNEVEIVGGLSDNNKVLKGSKTSVSSNVMSTLTVHHYLKDSETRVYEDVVSDVVFGSTYETSSIESSQLYDEYRNNYSVISNSGNVSGVVSNNNVEVTYYYAIEIYDISVSVIGGVGNVTGSEKVIGGNDSKEDIVIKPNDGYEISKIMVNGQEIIITDPNGMTLDKFKNVRENKNIEVEFKDKDHMVPITGINSYIYSFIAKIIICILFVGVYKVYTYKKKNGSAL